MSILFLISHTAKNHSLYEAIHDTWGAGRSCVFYSDHNGYPDILKVSDRSDFASNEEKFVNVVKTLPEKHLNHEWFFVSNDDTFVNVPLLESYVVTADPALVHGLIIAPYPSDPFLQYHSGGAGRLIGRDVFLHARKTLYKRYTGYSDVTFGMHLQEYRIGTVNSPLFHLDTPLKEGVPDSEVKNHITFHYVNPALMRHLQTLV